MRGRRGSGLGVILRQQKREDQALQIYCAMIAGGLLSTPEDNQRSRMAQSFDLAECFARMSEDRKEEK